MRLEWLPQSLNDFDDIIDYIAEDNPVAAIEQGDEIENQVSGLLANRHQGRPGRVKGTRELVIVRTPYIAAYRIQKDAIQILRIFHGARLWPERFRTAVSEQALQTTLPNAVFLSTVRVPASAPFQIPEKTRTHNIL